jgi:excisionase family DNA binding protein
MTFDRAEPAMGQNGWINTIRAAEYVGIAASTLEKLRCHGGGPRFAKRGRLVRYRLSDLDTWMSETLVQSTSELSE